MGIFVGLPSFITNVKASFCKTIKIKHRRIGAVIIIIIIAIVFNMFYSSYPILVGALTGFFSGTVIFFKENNIEKTDDQAIRR